MVALLRMKTLTAKIYRPDYGPDYYAAVVYNNLPAHQQPVSIGWINNWRYANDIPTTPWKSAMSLPRSLSVKRVGDEWILIQQPVEQVKQLRSKPLSWKNIRVKTNFVLPAQNQTCELEFVFTPATQSISGIRLAKTKDHYVEIGYDAAREMLYIDRSKAGDTSFHREFGKLSRFEKPLKTKNSKITVRIFFDKSIVELFANDGEAVMTAQIFPSEKNNAMELFSNGKDVVFGLVNYWSISSVW